MKKWIITSLTTFTFALAAVAYAAPGERSRGPQPERNQGPGHQPFLRMLDHPGAVEKLGLTGEQVDALKALKYETEESTIQLKAAAQLAHLEVRKLMGASEPDESAVMASIAKAGEAGIALRQASVKAMLKARTVLGEEKWQEIKQHRMKAVMRGRQQAMRGRGKDRAGPPRGIRGDRIPDRDRPPVED